MSIKAHNISNQYYGTAGKAFINYLIDTYSDNDYEEVKAKYKEVQDKLRKNVEKETVSTYIQSVSVIIIADIIMNKIFDFGFNEENSIELGVKILNQLETENKIDEIERAKEIVESWILENDVKFDRQEFVDSSLPIENKTEKTELLKNEAKSIEKYGMFRNDIYYILPNKFNDLMKKNNMNPIKIRKGFARKGYIEIDEKGKRNEKNVYYNGGIRRMIAFKMSNENNKIKDINIYGSYISDNIITEDILYDFSKDFEYKKKEVQDEI